MIKKFAFILMMIGFTVMIPATAPLAGAKPLTTVTAWGDVEWTKVTATGCSNSLLVTNWQGSDPWQRNIRCNDNLGNMIEAGFIINDPNNCGLGIHWFWDDQRPNGGGFHIHCQTIHNWSQNDVIDLRIESLNRGCAYGSCNYGVTVGDQTSGDWECTFTNPCTSANDTDTLLNSSFREHITNWNSCCDGNNTTAWGGQRYEDASGNWFALLRGDGTVNGANPPWVGVHTDNSDWSCSRFGNPGNPC